MIALLERMSTDHAHKQSEYFVCKMRDEYIMCINFSFVHTFTHLFTCKLQISCTIVMLGSRPTYTFSISTREIVVISSCVLSNE